MENNNVIKLMQDLEQEFLLSCHDAERFVLGNKSAGTRVRKCMQKIKKLAQEVRVEIQEQKNAVTA
tara:strand:+ start:449 stop:646 length:198 start_codon:yes stop_codon:yes gene_type:complete